MANVFLPHNCFRTISPSILKKNNYETIFCEQNVPNFEQKVRNLRQNVPNFEQKVRNFEPNVPNFEQKVHNFEQNVRNFKQKVRKSGKFNTKKLGFL